MQGSWTLPVPRYSLGHSPWLLPCLLVAAKNPQIPPMRLLGRAESKQQTANFSLLTNTNLLQKFNPIEGFVGTRRAKRKFCF